MTPHPLVCLLYSVSNTAIVAIGNKNPHLLVTGPVNFVIVICLDYWYFSCVEHCLISRIDI